jgi:hypothetical protein
MTDPNVIGLIALGIYIIGLLSGIPTGLLIAMHIFFSNRPPKP